MMSKECAESRHRMCNRISCECCHSHGWICPFPSVEKSKQVWCEICHRWTDPIGRWTDPIGGSTA